MKTKDDKAVEDNVDQQETLRLRMKFNQPIRSISFFPYCTAVVGHDLLLVCSDDYYPTITRQVHAGGFLFLRMVHRSTYTYATLLPGRQK